MEKIETDFTKMMGCKYPIIAAPMFLVSNPEMVIQASLSGAVGTFPTLNCRTSEELDQWLGQIKEKVGDLPFGVNLILHKSNSRLQEDKEIVFKHKVPLIISSLGNPQELINEARPLGIKVICDVINTKHAKKAVSVGVDGLIVVSVGAGGHAGTLSPFCSLPHFKKLFPDTMIIAAGGISSGEQLAASLALGASAVSCGTRFIASKEAKVEQGYKDAIVKSGPEDIFMSKALSGVNASVLKTKESEAFYNWDNSIRGKISQFITYKLMKSGLNLKKKYSWNNVWSAGQSVGEVEEVLSCKEIVSAFVSEYEKTRASLPELGNQKK
jgi:nitronate monooxygenase